MNNRQRMRASNKLVRINLLANGYDQIWFKPHGSRNDYVFTQRGTYMAQDIFNLFDGICIDRGVITFLQMKTNAWPKVKPLLDFIKNTKNIQILVLNVTNKSGSWIVHKRFYN